MLAIRISEKKSFTNEKNYLKIILVKNRYGSEQILQIFKRIDEGGSDPSNQDPVLKVNIPYLPSLSHT